VKSRTDYKHIPVLILTARDSEDDEVRALDNGADDYLRKPVSPKRLLSHVRALLRRNAADDANVVSLRNFVIDRDRFVVFSLDGNRIHLPRKEFELLFTLAQSPGKVFTRETLLTEVWGKELQVGARTIDVHVRKLRDKIGQDMIETVRGVGYRLVEH
jgi:two-component system alkaline phosphatase synthesis response regulator PhoP